jgi:ATP-dependent helicase Lhr and Lhr-like helicase
MALAGFHPAVTAWFDARFPGPTEPQARAWPSIQGRRHTLIAAPTGSGKTLAAFLAAIDDLVRQAERGELTDQTQVVYVSPLKALSNDIQKNLQEPLSGIGAELAIRGFPEVEIRTMVRTGDTPAREREIMVRRPPHIVVTTPESLYILLTSERGRKMLSTVRTVIVDEIHAVAGTKRGSHLALSLERLAALTQTPLTRIGLSATQKPIEDVARFLVGNAHVEATGAPECTIVDTGHTRRLDLALELPSSPLEVVMSGDVWAEIHERVADLVRQHRTTLVFVNTRRMAERVARHLSERLGDDTVTSHHGSLSREQRLNAEERLKAGQLQALVATASLELGIDIGDVDLVIQLGSTRSIATFLQRVGRSGHAVTGLPKGRLFPLSRDELVESAALLDAVRRGELDRLHIPEKPLDILAQQIVAEVAGREWQDEDLYQWARRAYPYRELSREEFEAIVHMLADGFSTRRGRRSAYLHRDAVNHRLRARRGARLSSITSGGAIPDTADYQVRVEPSGSLVGTVNEDFAIESMAGDIFQLGNASWQILRVETGTVRVADAHGQPPTIPFWVGEAPSRTAELSFAVSRFREEIGFQLEEQGFHGVPANGDPAAANGNRGALDRTVAWLTERGLPAAAAQQIVDYMALSKAALGVLPTQSTLVLERFFDESGGMQLVLHSPFGSRVNRAWGLALRKRFCRKFNFELQAAASEDAIVLSLGPTHSFPLQEVFQYLHPATVRDILVQALLVAPMFAVRWRWNAGRALAILRFLGGKKVPAQLQRMQAEDLLTLVFPDQKACAENLVGEREIPDHPLVKETIHDCLTEAMDIDALETILADVISGKIGLVARDLPEPSPLAQEILNAKPYAFLDDAPLEERRTQAVMSRRWLDPETASDLGALDPTAIDRVRAEAWPEAGNADELHDALMILGFVTEEEGRQDGWGPLLDTLIADRRATVLRAGAQALWGAAERLPDLLAVLPQATLHPAITSPVPRSPVADEALTDMVRGRLEALGPVTAELLGRPLEIPASKVESCLVALETEGAVLRGRFTPGAQETEWCDRRLLARIHRYTLNRLRQEIEPVTAEQFLRFLFRWQGLDLESRGEGPGGLVRVVEQLEGFSAAAVAWEADILPGRMKDYDPAWLDALCFSGRTAWARLLSPKQLTGKNAGPVRTTPIALVDRRTLDRWLGLAREENGSLPLSLSSEAQSVLEFLEKRGASFFGELQEGTRLLRTQVEEALAELVAWGHVHSDGFTGIRALLVPPDRRRGAAGRPRRRRAAFGVEDAGRWTTLARGTASPETGATLEHVAWVLLRRYGVVMKRLLEREGPLPPWRDLLRCYHRLEARGEIRGGRFVAGFTGEQFALPDAVGALREMRRQEPQGQLISVGGADPTNLVGIVTPGPKLAALPGNRVLYQDGRPLAVRAGGVTEFLSAPEAGEEWKAKKALLRRPFPERLRAYLGTG